MKGEGASSVSRATPSAWWIVPLVLLSLSALLSSRILLDRSGARSAGTGPAREGSLLLEISRRPALAFGFRNFLADVAWLDAVQVAGARRMSGRDYDRLDLLVKIVGNLDPRFAVPYLLGGLVLGNSPAHIGAALATLERGRAHHPEEWLFPFYIGYTKYFSLGDPTGGGRSIEDAARIPHSPRYLPLLASRMLTEGRDPHTALALLEVISGQETDPARMEILQKRIRDVIVERDLQILERAVEEYRSRRSVFPGKLSDLVASGILRALPEEPHGGRYVLTPKGEVRSDRIAHRLKVFRKP
jgi:hypothetical protein